MLGHRMVGGVDDLGKRIGERREGLVERRPVELQEMVAEAPRASEKVHT